MTEKNNENNNNDKTLEAALADLQVSARLHKQQVRLSSLSPLGGQSDETQALLTGQPLKLAEGQPDPRDAQITKALLDAYHQDDGWHCPKCGQVFTEPTPFAQHLIDELNRGLAAIASQTTGKQPPATTKPPTV